MKHLTFSTKNLLVGDDVADMVVRYAAGLARDGSADTVDVHAYGTDGDEVVATLLLDEGAPLMIESTHSDLPEPDNTEALEYMRERLQRLEARPKATRSDQKGSAMSKFEGEWGPA